MKQYDFVFGAQYYRAPTPARESWESDLKNFKENGFNSIKFWVQWGWTHRGENEFYFDDTDRLMDLAAQNGLKVTLNVIFDVAPRWFMRKYPESKIVLSNGTIVEPFAAGHRQIGGFPGTCYNHQAARDARMLFLQKTVERYKDHPAMDMWDVWNEPEQCGPYRYPKTEELPCYCDSCLNGFLDAMRQKHKTLDKLNDLWGRCYNDWDDVELPRERLAYSDFIDFREFQLDTMTNEANMRIDCVRKYDKKHPVYLHVVPNTSSIFNALTGVDDFALAKECDVFASTNFAGPIWSVLTTSAGKGKVCYNVECHIGNGTTQMHQKQITLSDMVNDLVPQIGMGLRGFMFWQYRPETLGYESPAWGVTKPDGSIGSVGIAAKQFIKALSPITDEIMQCPAPKAEIAIWKGRKNELLSFCINNSLGSFAQSIEAYVNAAYYNNYNCCIVDDERIKTDLDGIKLLILPSCYEADEELVSAVDKFVQDGGTLLCEAHFGGYNADTGRHSYSMPGVGADKLWNIREAYTTAAYHLKTPETGSAPDSSAFNDDVKKAIAAYGLNGGKYFTFETTLGYPLVGAERFACLEADGAKVIGKFGDEPCLVQQKRGKGYIYYCGTNLGEAACVGRESFEKFIVELANSAGVKKPAFDAPRGVHIDKLSDNIIVVNNTTENTATIQLDSAYSGLFFDEKTDSENCYIAPPYRAQILVKEKSDA